MLIIFSSCVSNKKYNLQQSRIAILESTVNEQKAAQMYLKKQNSVLSDSLKNFGPDFRQKQVEFEYQTYKRAINSGDKLLASQSLTRLLLMDSTQAYWACDSLSLYHYLYLMTPGVPRNNQAALYYTLMGLDLNPENKFLREMFGKLNLEIQNDSLAYQTFTALYEQYGDYTYLWESTFMDLYVFQNLKKTEAVIAKVVAAKDAGVKTVRIEETEERRMIEVPAKAAFLYFRASIQTSKGQLSAAKKTLEEVIKTAPAFMAAQRALYQLQSQRY